MKPILTSLLCLLVSYAYSQAPRRIDIPLASENSGIDSLMDMVIPMSKPNYKYFEINISDLGNSYAFIVFQLDTKDQSINFPVPQKDYMQHVFYINYKGNVIFVGGDHIPSGFFKLTSDKKNFNFIQDDDMFSDNTPKLFQGNFAYLKGRKNNKAEFIYMDPLLGGKPKKVKVDSL